MITLASLPGAVAVISYGGANVESGPVGTVDGESGVVTNAPGGGPIIFLASAFAKPMGGIEPIVVDPTVSNYQQYAHAYVYSGVNIPATTAGSGSVEWHGYRDASASGTMPTGDTINMKAIVDGGTRAAASSDGNNQQVVQAESLVDAFAGRTPAGAPARLIGNAQITSRVQIDTTGQAIAGTTARGTTGAGPQGEAKATFAADRTHNVGGATETVAKILGNAKGTTNVEATNLNNGPAGGQFAIGYATVNTFGATDYSNQGGAQNGHISYSSSDIRSSGYAIRQAGAGAGTTSVKADAIGEAGSQVWDPDVNWGSAKVAGTESAQTKVSGSTSALAEALRVGDEAYGNPIGVAGALSVNPPVQVFPNIWRGQVWSQIHAASASETDVTNAPAFVDNVRDAIAFTYTTAIADRAGASQADSQNNAVKAYTFLGDYSRGIMSNAEAVARDDSQTESTKASLSNVYQSSGAHRVSTNVGGTASVAGLVARATYDPAGATGLTGFAPNINNVADLGYGGGLNPFLLNGVATRGPAFNFNQFDAAGSLILADSQRAESTSSAGAASASSGYVKVQEWKVGNDPLNNLYVESPASVAYSFPQTGASLTPVVMHVAGNNLVGGWNDIYAWNGAVGAV